MMIENFWISHYEGADIAHLETRPAWKSDQIKNFFNYFLDGHGHIDLEF